MSGRWFKWMWLLIPTAVGLASIRSYYVLQLLSATLIFTALFLTIAILVALYALLVLLADFTIRSCVDVLGEIGSHLQSSFRNLAAPSLSSPAILLAEGRQEIRRLLAFHRGRA